MTRRMILALVVLGLAGWGCKTAGITQIGSDLGVITEEQKGSIDRTTEAFRRSFQDLTEEEENSLGRAVAANIIQRYGIYENAELTAYVNRVGKSVAVFSSRPEVFGGYHFAVLNTDEVNAFAAPGGFIFVTRGLLRLVPGEDALAGVLAHEVGHVAEKHGLAAINKNRLLEAFGVLGQEAGRTLQKDEITKLTELYDGAVGDIVKTLVVSGYSRDQEREADRDAVRFEGAVGYRPTEFLAFLTRMESAGSAGSPGMFATHPPAAERKAGLEPVVSAMARGTDPAPRQERFRLALATL